MSDDPDELPGMTRARAKELLAELSLIDLGRLLLSKAEGLQGLVHQGASVLEMSTEWSKLTVRLVKPKGRTKVFGICKWQWCREPVSDRRDYCKEHEEEHARLLRTRDAGSEE